VSSASSGSDDSVAVVRAFWSAIQARDWPAMRALLADDARMHWVTSGEWFLDAEAIVRVQSEYPEGWALHVHDIAAMQDGSVHAVVEVIQGGMRFYANSRSRLLDGRIAEITEYWATVEAPPDWRTPERLGAYRRDPLGIGIGVGVDVDAADQETPS